MIRRVLIVALGLSALAMGCLHRQAKGGPDDTPEFLQGATLDVENRGFVDCVIYVLHDGVRERVGTVVAVKSASFELRPAQLGSSGAIQLIAHPIGQNGSYTSESFLVRGGQSIEWTLADDLNRSFVAVY